MRRAATILLTSLILATSAASRAGVHGDYSQPYAGVADGTVVVSYIIDDDVPAEARPVMIKAGKVWSGEAPGFKFKYTGTKEIDEFVSGWRYKWCTYENSVHWDPDDTGNENEKAAEGGDYVAYASLCFHDGHLDQWKIHFAGGLKWYGPEGWEKQANSNNLKKVALHEFGHATSYADHATGSDLCPRQGLQAMMCSGGAHKALMPHDLDTFIETYPGPRAKVPDDRTVIPSR